MLTRINRLHALLLAALLSGCAAMSPGDRYVPPPVGTTYTSEFRDTGSYGSSRSDVSGQVVAYDWNGATVTGFQAPQSTLIVLPSGAFVGLVGRDGKMMTSWDPPAVWEFPLEVGKGWTKQYKLKLHAQNSELSFETRQVVEAYEEVKVPAGTFKSFRVRTSDTLGNENVQWFAPELGMFVKTVLRRTDKAAQGAGTRETELKAVSSKRSN
jgi:hypothetical protein